MKCPKCNHNNLYELKNNYKKCAKCYYKFSYKKYVQDFEIIKLFCSNKTANETAHILSLNYRTVSSKFTVFRKLITSHSEALYYEQARDNSSYEEYYYFTQRQKEKKHKSLYDAINIIGFYSNRKVFTLLMPSLVPMQIHDNSDSFERYLSWHKLQSSDAHKTPLKVFFLFLEQNIKKYKGVNKDNFIYYLKESEFKYNYLIGEQIELLRKLYF